MASSASTQTIKIGNLSVTISLETTTTPTTTTPAPAPTQVIPPVDELLFNTVAKRMGVPLNMHIRPAWACKHRVTQGVTITYEKFREFLKYHSEKLSTCSIEEYLTNEMHKLDFELDNLDYDMNDRRQLLRKIVKKRNIIFTEDMFTIYLEWTKTYIPITKQSRAKRMGVFLDNFASYFD